MTARIPSGFLTRRESATRIAWLVAGIGSLQFLLNGFDRVLPGSWMVALWLTGGTSVLWVTFLTERHKLLTPPSSRP